MTSPCADAVPDLPLDLLRVERGVELGQLRQAVEGLVRVAEVEGRVRALRVVEEVEVGQLLFFLRRARNAC